MWRGWSGEITEKMLDMWRAGKSAGQIGIALGITRSAVIGKVHRMGLQEGGIARVSSAPAQTLWTKDETAEFLRLADQGMCARDISDRMGIEFQRVRSKASNMGIRLAPQPARKTSAPPRPVAKPTLVYDADSPAPERGITVVEMPLLGRCRFPIWGSGAEMRMCGEVTEPDTATYCPGCAVIAYNPTTATQNRSMHRGALFVANRERR